MLNLRLKIILHLGLIGVCYLFVGLFPFRLYAQSMSNNNYIIQTEEINPVSATDLNSNSKPSVEKQDPNVSESVNVKVRSGFGSELTKLPFSASLSSDIVDFGNLSPTNPIVRTIDLGIANSPIFGYSVLAFEDHALRKDSEFIPDTTCDNGDCSQESPGVWTNTLTYGFGYRCDNLKGADCNNSFMNQIFYKHFSDISSSEVPQSITKGIGTDDKSVRLSYKANVAETQAQGEYSNTITFIAVPNF